MDCHLNNNVTILQVRPKKLLLKSGKVAKSTDERMPKDLILESLSTLESETAYTEGSTTLRSTKSYRNTRLEISVDEHPLYVKMKDSQVKTYDEFVRIANDEFNEISQSVTTTKSLKRKCLDELNLLRFLKARNFKIPAALKMWRNWVEWRSEFKFPTKQDVQYEEMRKHFKIYKQDKQGNPLVVITPGLYDGELDIETTRKICVYVIEKATKRSDRHSYGTISVIFDRKGITQAKDKRWFGTYKMMGQILQDYYPERLNVAYVVNANWFTKIMIGM
jgi:ribosomal protein L31